LLISSETEPVNIGNPDEITVTQIAKEIIELTKSSSNIVYKDLPIDDPKVRQPDITKAMQVLGWNPKVTRLEGLNLTLNYFKEMIQN
jgi:dTDP-glucose 4,6-dehydratase